MCLYSQEWVVDLVIYWFYIKRMCIYEAGHMIDPVLVPDEELKGVDYHMSLQNRETEKAVMTSKLIPLKGSWFLLLLFYNSEEFYSCALLHFVF